MREYKYVPASDPFMQEAKIARETLSGDPSYPVGAVLTKDGRVIARAGNGYNLGQANRHVCPRIVLECPSGTGYELCHLHDAPGHAEQMLIKVAHEEDGVLPLFKGELEGVLDSGFDVYMYGHWWCCEPCWKVMIEAGVRDVYLVENAQELFDRDRVYAETLKPSVKSVYISGGLTNLPADVQEAKKKFYEALVAACEALGCRAYIPHLHNDPDQHPDISARDVFDHDTKTVQANDVFVAEVTHQSLGTGGEIVVAQTAGRPVVLVSKKGTRVSRYARGNPAVVYHIEYDSEDQACRQLKNVLRQL